MVNNMQMQSSKVRPEMWIALVLAACALVLPPVAEQLYHYHLVVPTAERELLRRFDTLLAEYPERIRSLKAAHFTGSKVGGDCSDCFNPTMLDRIGKIYVSTVDRGQQAFYAIGRSCSPDDVSCVNDELARTPVSQGEVMEYLDSVDGFDDCVDTTILLYGVRYCYGTLTYLGEVHGATLDVRIQPARLNPVAWLLRSVDPKGWVHIDYETGACTYSNLISISDRLRDLRCVNGNL